MFLIIAFSDISNAAGEINPQLEGEKRTGDAYLTTMMIMMMIFLLVISRGQCEHSGLLAPTPHAPPTQSCKWTSLLLGVLSVGVGDLNKEG